MELAKQRAVLVADLARRGAKDALVAYQSLVDDFADQFPPPILLNLLPRPAQFYLEALRETRLETRSENLVSTSKSPPPLPARTVHDRARVCFHWDISVHTISLFFNNATSQDFFRILSQFAGTVDMEPALQLLQEAYDERTHKRSRQRAKILDADAQSWSPCDVRRAMRRSGRFGQGITRTRQKRCRRGRQDEPSTDEGDSQLDTLHQAKMGGVLAPNHFVSAKRAVLRGTNQKDARIGTESYGGLQKCLRFDSAQHQVSWNRLRLGQELDDTMIEAGLRLATAASSNGQVCVMPLLCSGAKQPLPYGKLSQLTKLVLATILTKGNHWALVVVQVPQQSIDLFGAIGEEVSDDGILNLLSQHLMSALATNKSASSHISWLSAMQTWPVRRPPSTTQYRPRAEDSGVGLLVHAFCTIADVSIPSHIDMELWRRIIACLTRGPLHALGGCGEDRNDIDKTSPSPLLKPGEMLLDIVSAEKIEDLGSQLPPGISGAQSTSMGVVIEYIIMYEVHRHQIAEKGAQIKRSQAACLVVDEVASLLGVLGRAEPYQSDTVLGEVAMEARQRFSAVRMQLMRERDMLLTDCQRGFPK